MIFQAIQSHAPDAIVLLDSKQSIRYGELDKEINKRAELLKHVSALGLALDNSVEWILQDLAALQAGVVCVPLPPFFTSEQTSHAIRTAGISHILSNDGLASTGIETSARFPVKPAKITFTSGTTGTPKGVCLSKNAMEKVAASLVEVIGNDVVGIHACVLPLSILLENVAGVYAGLMAGCTIQLINIGQFGPRYENLHECLSQEGANSIILVPEYLRILLSQVRDKGLLPELKFIAVGGSKIAPALVERARETGLPVYEGYGLSECASVVSLNTPRHDRVGTVGKLLPHVRAAIVNGEVMIEEPGFLGYVGRLAPLVFPTGDLGTLDDEGFLTITGRKKNVLITSRGRNISPEWVEAALLVQPEIAQAVVYGDAQPFLSALIVPARTGVDMQLAVNRANATLPDYAHVNNFHIVPPFTAADDLLTGSGRVRREAVLQRYLISQDKEKTDDVLPMPC